MLQLNLADSPSATELLEREWVRSPVKSGIRCYNRNLPSAWFSKAYRDNIYVQRNTNTVIICASP